MTEAGESKVSAFAVFRNRNFTLLWSGQLVSTIGTSLTSLAASILVYRLTGSALSVGLMLMATVIPTLVVGLIAGVFVDRYDRRRIMIASDVIRGFLVLLIPFLVPYSIVWLYVLIMLTSAVGQFFAPAEESLLPDVASEEELGAANSMLAISSFGSTAIGFAAAGLIASAAAIEWAFYLDALTFLLSAACILAMRVPSYAVDEKTNIKVVMRNLKAGLQYMFDSQILRSLVIVSVPIMVAFGMWNTLLLPFATEALGATEFEYGVQEALTSVGFVVGSLLMAGLVDRLREGQWMALSWLGMGIFGVFYAGATSIPVAFALVTLSGFMNAPGAIGRRLILQRYTEREIRGRVASAYFVSRDVVYLVGMALAGLADVLDVRWMMLAASLLILFGGALAAVLPGLRQPAARVAAGGEPVAQRAGRARAGGRPGGGAGRPEPLRSPDACLCRAEHGGAEGPAQRHDLHRGTGRDRRPAPRRGQRRCLPDPGRHGGGRARGGWPGAGAGGTASRRFLWRDCGPDRSAPHGQRDPRGRFQSVAGTSQHAAPDGGLPGVEPCFCEQNDRTYDPHEHDRHAPHLDHGPTGHA